MCWVVDVVIVGKRCKYSGVEWLDLDKNGPDRPVVLLARLRPLCKHKSLTNATRVLSTSQQQCSAKVNSLNKTLEMT